MRKTDLRIALVAAFLACTALAVIPQIAYADYYKLWLSDTFGSMTPYPPHGWGFTKWSGVSKSYLENAYVTREGYPIYNYFARFTSDSGTGGTSGEYSYAYKYVGPINELDAQGNFRVKSSGMYDNGDQIHLVEIVSTSGYIVAYAGWARTSGVNRWYLGTRNGPNYVVKYYYLSSPALNTWYTVKLTWYQSTYGQATLIVNGKTILYFSPVNTNYYGNVNRVRMGLPRMYGCTSTVADLDVVKVSTFILG